MIIRGLERLLGVWGDSISCFNAGYIYFNLTTFACMYVCYILITSYKKGNMCVQLSLNEGSI